MPSVLPVHVFTQPPRFFRLPPIFEIALESAHHNPSGNKESPMKLLIALTIPYARKPRIVVDEKLLGGLDKLPAEWCA